MFLIKAVLKKNDVSDVLSSLKEHGFIGVTIFEVLGTDSNPKSSELKPYSQLELVVANSKNVKLVVDVLRENCSKDKHGMGKVWWLPVEGIERIETGEKNLDALSSFIPKGVKEIPVFDNLSNIDTPCS